MYRLHLVLTFKHRAFPRLLVLVTYAYQRPLQSPGYLLVVFCSRPVSWLSFYVTLQSPGLRVTFLCVNAVSRLPHSSERLIYCDVFTMVSTVSRYYAQYRPAIGLYWKKTDRLIIESYCLLVY